MQVWLVVDWFSECAFLSCFGHMVADIGVWLAAVLIHVACPVVRKKTPNSDSQSTT
jgi:hypothetical protein